MWPHTVHTQMCIRDRKIARTIEEGRLTPKVIITVDLFGLPANYPAIRKIADAHRLFILEDGAQGFGGMIGNKRACSFGDISTTSFFPPSLWAVTATAERCLPTTTNGLHWQIPTGCTARACSSLSLIHIYLGFSPERVDPGNAVYKTKNTPKVVGAVGKDAQDVIAAMYGACLLYTSRSSPCPPHETG